MLRLIKIALIILVGIWGLLGGIGNLAGYEAGHALVQGVMMREGAITAGGPFITMSHPLLTHFGYAVIWVGKLTAGFFCFWGAARLWLARNADAVQFNAAKTTALSGCGIALLMLFGGFYVAGGVYFGMWSSVGGQASHGFASQYIIGIGIVALFVASPEP